MTPIHPYRRGANLMRAWRRPHDEAMESALDRDAARGQQVSCRSCTAPAGCCHQKVYTQLVDVMPLAEQLRAEGRDTPELRADLLEAARAIEETPTRAEYVPTPCVFLDGERGCSVYENRPMPCRLYHVRSDPALCSAPSGTTVTIVAWPEVTVRTLLVQTEMHHRLKLRTKPGRVYFAALPRAVLQLLETWDAPRPIEALRSRYRWPSLPEAERMDAT